MRRRTNVKVIDGGDGDLITEHLRCALNGWERLCCADARRTDSSGGLRVQSFLFPADVNGLDKQDDKLRLWKAGRPAPVPPLRPLNLLFFFLSVHCFQSALVVWLLL
jgi:hypothetical protein